MKRKMSVAFFCLIGGGLSTYYILEAVLGVRKENRVSIEHIRPPRSPLQNEMRAKGDIIIDEDTWRKLQYFEGFMDSLKKNNSAAYEKMLMDRPGLMDSLQELETIYYSQKIK